MPKCFMWPQIYAVEIYGIVYLLKVQCILVMDTTFFDLDSDNRTKEKENRIEINRCLSNICFQFIFSVKWSFCFKSKAKNCFMVHFNTES